MSEMRQYTAENLVIHPDHAAAAGVIVEVTPARAGWDTIHFQARRLAAAGAWSFETVGHELALVVLGGTLSVASDKGEWRHLGRRANVFNGLPRLTASHHLPTHCHRLFTLPCKKSFGDDLQCLSWQGLHLFHDVGGIPKNRTL